MDEVDAPRRSLDRAADMAVNRVGNLLCSSDCVHDKFRT